MGFQIQCKPEPLKGLFYNNSTKCIRFIPIFLLEVWDEVQEFVFLDQQDGPESDDAHQQV